MSIKDQEQFLDVVASDEAILRWAACAGFEQREMEIVELGRALGRVLAEDVVSEIDVPAFDRSNVDGYAVRAADTFEASEARPCRLRLNREILSTGRVPATVLEAGQATAIATGGMLPRGADAVVMVENTSLGGDSTVLVRKPVTPGEAVSFAGTDVARGELILRRGTLLGARETGVLAAIGAGDVPVVRRPVVAILSTGDELVSPGETLRPGHVHDANQTLLADSVRELGCEARPMGIVGDDLEELDRALTRALDGSDLVILSGGTSKGEGDLSYRVLARHTPGVRVHGVALKPGKPVCLGAIGDVPVAILPGFPTSAVFTFHLFVTPALRRMLGARLENAAVAEAAMPQRVNSERGREEFLLVRLVEGEGGLLAYPMGKGSGSVTTFSRADGFVRIAAAQEYVHAGERMRVTALGRSLEPADLTVIGSHCVGLDYILGQVAAEGPRIKTLWVGSQGGLDAAARGACDAAGIHLLDAASGIYNLPHLPPGVRLLEGYRRKQGIVVRADDARFAAATEARTVVEQALADTTCIMVNRNRGSGTRILIDELLRGARPPGYWVEPRSHNAVAAAVAGGRADWGVAIETVAARYGLRFLPLRDECFDLAIPASRWERPGVETLREVIMRRNVRNWLREHGFALSDAEKPDALASTHPSRAEWS
jgi:putative molybdopterin biosynthesis protein